MPLFWTTNRVLTSQLIQLLLSYITKSTLNHLPKVFQGQDLERVIHKKYLKMGPYLKQTSRKQWESMANKQRFLFISIKIQKSITSLESSIQEPLRRRW